jgi:hypothetical protein
MARTAVVAGTATAVSNRVSRRQYNRWSDQEAAQQQQQAAAQPQYVEAAPAPAAAAAPSAEEKIALLKEIAELHDSGILSDAEFEVQKAKILNS